MTRRPSRHTERGRLAPAWVSWTMVAILVVLALIAFLAMVPVLVFWHLWLGVPATLILVGVPILLFGIPTLAVWRLHRRDIAKRV